jgi:hypothetical protein
MTAQPISARHRLWNELLANIAGIEALVAKAAL